MARATVLSDDGEVLAEARLHPSAGGASPASLLEASGRQRLVSFYFGQGGRSVIVVGPGHTRRRGRIVATAWRPGGRLWRLEAE